MAALYQELFAGLGQDPMEVLAGGLQSVGLEGSDGGSDAMVIVREIPFHSLCEHHLLPFLGVAHIGYVPDGRVVGLSKLARLLEVLARRPQLQERLTEQVADCLAAALKPYGAAVVLEAEHLCMTIRGVKKPGSRVVTAALRGDFQRSAVSKAEFLALVRGR